MSMSSLNTSVEVKKLDEAVNSLLLVDKHPTEGTTLFAKISLLKERLGQARDGVGFTAGYTHVSEAQIDTFNETLIRSRLNALTDPTTKDDDFIAICRQSTTFNQARNNPFALNLIRFVYATFIADHGILSFKNHQDAWSQFDEYASTGAREKAIEIVMAKFNGKKIRTMKPTAKHVGYTVYDSDLGGPHRYYNNGMVTQHRNRNVDISFCIGFVYSQSKSTK